MKVIDAIAGLGIPGWCFHTSLGVATLKIRLWTNKGGGQPLSPEFAIPVYITS